MGSFFCCCKIHNLYSPFFSESKTINDEIENQQQETIKIEPVENNLEIEKVAEKQIIQPIALEEEQPESVEDLNKEEPEPACQDEQNSKNETQSEQVDNLEEKRVVKDEEEDSKKNNEQNEQLSTVLDENAILSTIIETQSEQKQEIEQQNKEPPSPFPSSAELNARFRKLIALHQRTYPKDLKMDNENQFLSKFAKKNMVQQNLMQEREMKKLEERQRWSRREEAEFYRALIAYGVERHPDSGDFVWDRFKELAKLKHKLDHTLSEYYHSFEAMCKRVCHRSLTKEEAICPKVCRATKVAQRVDFMARLRSLLKPTNQKRLEERIPLAKRTADLPDWWECGKHDLELLKGVSKHGLSKTEETIILDPEFSFKEIFLELQKEVNSNRAITRNFSSRLASGSSSDKDERSVVSPTKRYSTTDQIISDILSDQPAISSEILVHWPKERTIVVRLQNLCFLIEHGEWPTGNKAANLFSLPDWPTLPEGSGLDYDSKYDLTDARLEDYKMSSGRGGVKMRNSGGGANSKQQSSGMLNIADLYQTTLANKMMKMKHQSSGLEQTMERPDSNDGSRRHGSGRRGRKAAASANNPLQDLMEGEKERVRSLMHQTFLQQLELGVSGGPSSSGLGSPFGLLPAALSSPQSAAAAIAALTAAGLNVGGAPGSTQAGNRNRPLTVRESLARMGRSANQKSPTGCSTNQKSSKSNATDQALNLSTKRSSTGDCKQDDKSKQSLASLPGFDQNLFNSTNMFNNLSAANLDSRIPLINLRDGSRLTGKEAPMLKNLAAFLFENQHYMIDMMAQTGLINFDHELEPGEIIRGSASKLQTSSSSNEQRSTPKGAAPTGSQSSRNQPSGSRSSGGGGGSSSGGSDPQTHVAVINRKNGLKLTGQKAPQLKNLAVWLEKNPDWEVDWADLAQQPQSLKATGGASTSHQHESTKESKHSSSSSKMQSKESKSSMAGKPMALGASPLDLLLAGGGIPGFDPWASLLTGGLPFPVCSSAGSSGVDGAAAAAAAAALFPFLNPFLGAGGSMPFGLPMGGGPFSSAPSRHHSPVVRQSTASSSKIDQSPTKATKMTSSSERSMKSNAQEMNCSVNTGCSILDFRHQSSSSDRNSSNQRRQSNSSTGELASSSASAGQSAKWGSAGGGHASNELGHHFSAAALEQLTAAAALASLNPSNQLTGGGQSSGSAGASPAATVTSSAAGLGSSIFGASSNPFLPGLGSSPFFGSAPMPFGPSNLTAIAQLQALMGLQNIDASTFNPLFGSGNSSSLASPFMNPSPSSSSAKESHHRTPSSSTVTAATSGGQSKSSSVNKQNIQQPIKSKQSSEQPIKSAPSTKPSTPTTTGGGRKLNALADKLANSRSATLSKSSGSGQSSQKD